MNNVYKNNIIFYLISLALKSILSGGITLLVFKSFEKRFLYNFHIVIVFLIVSIPSADWTRAAYVD